MAQAEAGKGSAPRINQDRGSYASGWERIFGAKNEDNSGKEATKESLGTAGNAAEGGEAPQSQAGGSQ